MTMTERRRSAAPPPPTDRLRVITAGRVGNMEARLGTSGFDVVAVAESEQDLVVAIQADDPDAIVVEADLCDSLEHVRALAPDAVLIVVGDHTPAGALGRIERGVTGTVMAGLLHALVTDGVGAAVVFGLVPAVRPPAALRLPAHLANASARWKVGGGRIADAVRSHASMAAAVGTVVVTAAAGVFVATHRPGPHERAEPRATAVVESPAPIADAPVVTVSPSPRRPVTRAMPPNAGTGSSRPGTSSATAPRPDQHGTPPTEHGSTPPPSPPSPPSPSPTDPPKTKPTPSATHPPGKAKGWDHRPPKDEHGKKNGWSKDKGKHGHGP